ncbi:MAG TPA: hypothetical protein VFA11_01985 [Acidimicrobiales bacterium]|nr:hypothetical protein [Acidimicrobiales bacterium]
MEWLIIAIATSTARRIGEIGFAIGALGALLIAFGAFTQAGADPNAAAAGRRMSETVGGLMLGVCFVLQIVSLHWA